MDIKTMTPLEHLTLFEDLSPAFQDTIQGLCRLCCYAAGEVIFEQGDPANYLYILLEGEVQVRFKPDDGPALVVARVRPQGVVGWSAVLGSVYYTSAALCSVDSSLLRISSQDLRELYLDNPEMGALMLERLAAVIAERLSNTHERVITMLEQGLRINGKNL